MAERSTIRRSLDRSSPGWKCGVSAPSSFRRPSPYHGVPIGVPARDYRERPDQRLCFSPVGTGSGRFAPDATSQIRPSRSRRRSPCPPPVPPPPDPCSVRAAAEQDEHAGAVRGGSSADGYPPGGDDPPAPLTSGIDRAIRLSTAVAVLAVGHRGDVSYWHPYAVVRAHGETGITARLEPATIDGLVYASSMVVLSAARHRVPAPSLARQRPAGTSRLCDVHMQALPNRCADH